MSCDCDLNGGVPGKIEPGPLFPLGETFTAIKIGGALIVMAGVAYAQFAGRRVEEAEEQIDSA